MPFLPPPPFILRIKKTAFTVAFLIFAAAICHAQKDLKTSDGILDLRNTNFSSSQPELKGKWEFYWNQLISTGAGKDTIYTSFNTSWSDVKDKDGNALPSKGYATYRLSLLLPEEKANLGLKIPDFYGSYNLFVNGKRIAGEGEVGTSKDSTKLFWKTKIIPLSVTSDTTVINLQISNFQLARGGAAKLISIGDYSALSLDHIRETAIDWLLSGSLFIGGLFFLGMFWLGTRDKAIFFFALFCIIYSFRMAGTDNYALHEVFPSLSWQLSLRAEYLSVCIPAILFSYYLFYLYPKDINKIILYSIVGISSVYALLILAGSIQLFSSLLPYYLTLLLVFIGYAFSVFIKAAVKKRPGAEFGLWSNMVAVVIFLIAILNYFNIIPQLKLLQAFAYITFFFLQSLILSKRFSHTLIKSRQDAEAGLQEKSNFLSTMSHEIRTPLNAVIGITELMKFEKMSDEETKENVELLSFSANNLLAIINDILDFSRIDAQKVQFESVEIDIPSIINNVVKSNQSIASKKSIKLNIHINPNVPKLVIGDPLRLTQILNNLINNAIKFTDYGFVTITAERQIKTKGKDTISFKIIDTGIGIKEDKLELIFDVFSQADSSTARSFGGTGLGLAITSRLLKLQGSELKVESKFGRGSVFYFIQDFDKYTGEINNHAVTLSNTKVIKETAIELTNATILLTEDNELNILFTKKQLEKWGIKVCVAHNGLEAVEMFKDNHDLILMDLQMPGMDGFEASSLIREKNKQVPIIAFTANTESTVREKIYLSGMNDMITKPFAPDMLKNIITKYLKAS